MYFPKKGAPFYRSLTFLSYLHIYPSKNGINNLKSFYINSVLVRIATGGILVSCIARLFKISIENGSLNLKELMMLVGISYTTLIAVLFQLNAKQYSGLFLSISKKMDSAYAPKLDQTAKKYNFYSTIYYIYWNVGTIVYAFVGIVLEGATCRELKKMNGTKEVCGLIFPIWWPFDNYPSMLTICLLNVYEAIVTSLSTPVTAVVPFATFECAEIIRSKIEHLKERLKSSFREEMELADIQVEIRRNIQNHQEILRIIKDFNDVNKVVFGQMIFAAAIILGIYISNFFKEKQIIAILYGSAFMFSVFLICRAGQIVQKATESIKDAIYESQWYMVNPKLTKDLQFVMLRCTKPSCLKTIPIGFFNYELFLMILKATYSYVTLIKNTS